MPGKGENWFSNSGCVQVIRSILKYPQWQKVIINCIGLEGVIPEGWRRRKNERNIGGETLQEMDNTRLLFFLKKNIVFMKQNVLKNM
jgi:hypothetical protein